MFDGGGGEGKNMTVRLQADDPEIPILNSNESFAPSLPLPQVCSITFETVFAYA